MRVRALLTSTMRPSSGVAIMIASRLLSKMPRKRRSLSRRSSNIRSRAVTSRALATRQGGTLDVDRGASIPLQHPPRTVLVAESGAQQPFFRTLHGDAPQFNANRLALFRMAEIEGAPADELLG